MADTLNYKEILLVKNLASDILSNSYKISTMNTNSIPKENPKSSFIRCVWGVTDKNFMSGHNRRIKVGNDILFAKMNPYEPLVKVYVFGEENYKILIDMGFNCTLISKESYVFNREKEEYRHKLEAWKYGQNDFDEIVFLDWDCMPLRPIDYDFWDVMRRGSKIQATIYMYMREKALWRLDKDPRKISAATFVYMKEPNIANDIIKIWESLNRTWREELALTLYIEKINNGWRGTEDYKNKFEPLYHTLFYHYDKTYKTQMLKYNTFFHLNRHKMQYLLGNKKNSGEEEIIKRISLLYKREISYINRRSKK